MSKENENKKYDGQNSCRRCDRLLSDPNDIYGWRCAEIVGLGGGDRADILDDGELLLYNDYINLHSLHEKSEPRGNFTTKGKNYKNSFVKEKTEKQPIRTKQTRKQAIRKQRKKILFLELSGSSYIGCNKS